MTYQDIQNANKSIKTTDIKGKAYAEVNERIRAFRMLYPEGFIETTVLRLEEGVCVMRAEVGYYQDGNRFVLGTGTAYEVEGSTFINKTSYIENCETSCCGRALSMVGLGIDTSVASYEEVANAIKQQEASARIIPETPVCPICGKDVKDTKTKDGRIMSAQKIFEKYGMCADCKRSQG